MDKDFYRQCIEHEVYALSGKMVKPGFFGKVQWKYLSPSGNAVYLIRKMQYYAHKGWLGNKYALYLRGRLIRKYGIFINLLCTIDIGLRIPHPTSIVLTNATIGRNFTIYQGCTIGQKGNGEEFQTPVIGNDVTMYANSSIVGRVIIGNNVTIAAHCCMVKNAPEAGIYVGCPGKLIKQNNNC